MLNEPGSVDRSDVIFPPFKLALQINPRMRRFLHPCRLSLARCDFTAGIYGNRVRRQPLRCTHGNGIFARWKALYLSSNRPGTDNQERIPARHTVPESLG